MKFQLPALGENIESGAVVRVLVKKGDTVTQDQTLLELETDKAVLEIPAPVAGSIQDIAINEGDEIKVGQLVCVIAESGDAPAAVEEEEETVAEKVEEVIEVEEEDEDEDDEDEITEVIEETPAPAPEPKAAPAPEPKPQATKAAHKSVLASPSTRKLAREIGVDLALVPGTGSGGRITIADVKNFSKNQKSEAVTPTGAPIEPLKSDLPDFKKWGPIETEPASRVRLMTAQSMSTAWNQIPHVTQFDDADITEVMKLRKKFAPRVEASGGKLTITAIILKVAASALKVFPQINASLDLANKQVIYKKYYHIGVAVDTDRGLLVPVIRDVDQKNILELSVDLNTVAAKARDRKITPDEMKGATFTISNLGGLGTTYFTPIVNHPQVAILGIGRAKQTPVLKDGNWEPRLILPLSLSYDHRLIDGADAARFLRWIAEAVQEPFLMDLEG